ERSTGRTLVVTTWRKISQMTDGAATGGTGRLPLTGFRVLELSHIVAGPSGGLLLADLGADVIKVEEPRGGDQSRAMPNRGSTFYALNRNKRSLAVDLKSEAGREIFTRLVRGADILLDNYAPGGWPRWAAWSTASGPGAASAFRLGCSRAPSGSWPSTWPRPASTVSHRCPCPSGAWGRAWAGASTACSRPPMTARSSSRSPA